MIMHHCTRCAVYRVFRGNDPVLKRASFMSIVKGGNVEKYNARTAKELDVLLDKLPEELTAKDFKYFMRTISDRAAPKRGISVKALAKFLVAHKFQKYSIEQFITNVVLPQTNEARCSFASLFAEYVDKDPVAVAAPVGTVTHFVCLSNSNKPPLSSVINSLVELERSRFSSEPGNISTGAAMYVWLDMLCLNLHDITDSFDDSSSQRHWQLEDHICITDQVIEQAEHVVLFLDNWRNPAVFSDGPCLCEMFLAKVNVSKLVCKQACVSSQQTIHAHSTLTPSVTHQHQVHSKRPRLLVDIVEKDAFEEAVLVSSFVDTQHNLARARDVSNAHFATRSERSRWESFMRERNQAVGSTSNVLARLPLP